MKKAVFLVLSLITVLSGIVLSGISGQSLWDYTLLMTGNLGDVGTLTATKFAVPREITTATIQGQTPHIVEVVTLAGRTLLAFEMTAEQIRQRDTIRSEKDTPFVLFTRRGTNRDNYRFIVDRIIPLKNIFGVVTGSLPENFNASDFYEVTELYMRNPVIDPDGRVAEKIRLAQVQANRAREIANAEAARRLDAANREAFLNEALPVYRHTEAN